MSSKTPPTLQELARQSLVRGEALAISALKDIPVVHFPPLFKEAFNQTWSKILKVMVQEWPFPCLPLGALMKDCITPDWSLQAVLEGIDTVLLQKVHPRRHKLELLDLRTLDPKFWNTWYGATAGGWSTRRSETQAAVCHSRTVLKQPFKVVIDLDLTTTLSRLTTYIFEWVDQRKALVHLYCHKLQIREPSFPDRRKILQMFYLYHTQELHLQSISFPCSLINFSPYLGCMRRLHKLFLRDIWENDFITSKMKQKIITQFALELCNMQCLQELHVDAVPFLEGHLDKMLRCVRTPLETLSVANYKLSASEWSSLPEFPCTNQLKHLKLRNVILTHLSLVPLYILLVKAAGTLMTLELKDCCIGGIQLSAILPALSKCSQLTMVNFSGNQVSTSVLKNLLHHTGKLRPLILELDPVPQESYDNHDAHHIQ